MKLILERLLRMKKLSKMMIKKKGIFDYLFLMYLIKKENVLVHFLIQAEKEGN